MESRPNLMDVSDLSFDFATLTDGYRRTALTPSAVVRAVYQRIRAATDNPVWISLRDEAEAVLNADALYARAAREGIDALPLYGIPFAVKDNIDVAGVPTTAACPEFCYAPEATATVVQLLERAGAIFIGKTNLDQFATGLTGTRSPYGVCRNAFDARFIAGGSSSGSALAVALGHVSFALGTDTAGSGRVPAGFNNIVGLKPSRGLLSTAGVVPACRSLDCVSVFALTADDVQTVFEVAQAADHADVFSRSARVPQRLPRTAFRFGVPRREQWEFFGDTQALLLFERSIERMCAAGGTPVEIDFAPFRAAGDLLYNGPWVAERYAALKGFLNGHGSALHPVTRAVLDDADHYSATDAFEGLYRLKALEQDTRAAWRDMDVLLVPTAGTIYRIDDVLANPLALNANLGHYTNFVNLLDLCALALPAGFRADGLPFGITLIAPPLHDAWLCALGAIYHRHLGGTLGATRLPLPPAASAIPKIADDEVPLAVVGAHLTGLPLNHQLIERGARLLRACRTTPRYKLFALPNTQPPKPGLVFTGDAPGHAIEVEVWAVPVDQFGSFVAAVPPPLAIGTVTLDDGTQVKGFVCEGYAVRSAEDISHFGGWRNYLASKTG